MAVKLPPLVKTPRIEEEGDRKFTQEEIKGFGYTLPPNWGLMRKSGQFTLIAPYEITETQLTSLIREKRIDLPFDELRPTSLTTLSGVTIPITGYVSNLPVDEMISGLETRLAGELPEAERIMAERELANLKRQFGGLPESVTMPGLPLPAGELLPQETRLAELEAQLTDTMRPPERMRIEKEIAELKRFQEVQAGIGEVFTDMELAEIQEYYFLEVEDINAVPPGERVRVEEQQRLATERFDEFLTGIREVGRTPEIEALLTNIFPEITPENIDWIFEPTVEEYQEEVWVKDLWDALYLSTARTWYNVKESYSAFVASLSVSGAAKISVKNISPYLVTVDGSPVKFPLAVPTEEQWNDPEELKKILPAPLYERYLSQRDTIALESIKDYTETYIRGMNTEEYQRGIERGLKGIETEAKSKVEFGERQKVFSIWLREHPELIPRPGYDESPFKNPSLFLDPYWYGYVIASAAPPILATAAVAIGTTVLTGNVFLGAAAGSAVYAPMEIGALYTEAINSGASPSNAGVLATGVGSAIAAVEIIPSMIVLRIVAPGFTKIFGKTLGRDLTKAVVQNLSAKGILLTAAKIDVSESITEVLQEIMSNAALKTVNENKGLLENIPETFIQSMIAFAPLAFLGGGTQYLSMKANLPKDTQQQIDNTAAKLKEEGLSEEHAEAAAVAEILETEKGRAQVEVAIDKVAEAPTLPEIPTIQRDISETWDVMGQPAQTVLAEKAGIALTVVGTKFADLTSVQQDNLRAVHAEARATQPVTPEVAPEAIPEAEIEGLREYLKTDPVAQEKFTLGGKQVRLESFISIREGTFPEYFTVKQAKSLFPEHSFAEYAERGTPKYNRVPKDVALDDLTKKFNMSPDEIGERVMWIRDARKKIKEFLFEEKGLLTIGKDEAPKPKGATKKVFDRIQIEAPDVGLKEKISRGWHNFNVKMVDDLYSLKKFTEEYTSGGVELSIAENPYMLARLLKGVNSKATAFIERGTFGKNFWRVEKGKAVPHYTGESLESVLKEVREPRQWQDFSTYLVARRSFDLWSRNIETGISQVDALSAIEELETKYKNFPDLAKRVYKYQDNLLVYARETGLLSNDLLAKLRKYGDYVPFYRVFNELQSKGFMGKKMANIAQPIKRIKGSEREIINPLESIVKNTYVLITTADRNMVGISMANLVDQNPELANYFERVKTPMARVARVNASELGVEIDGLTKEDTEQIVDIFRPSFFVRGDEVTVLIDGKKAYFKIDPDLRDALLNLDRESIGILGKILGYPAKWLRAGATLSPDFMVRNPARDQQTAFCYSNYGFLPGFDFMKGIASLLSKDADYQLYKMSGAEHSMMVSMDRMYLQKTFKEVVEGKKFTDYVKHPLELFQIISELGEKATRLGEFKRGIARGAVPLEAGYSSRAVSLDFSQAGTTAHALNRLIAFFNANIRGWGRMVSSFKEHPTRTAFKIFVGITLPSILLYYANRDDPRWEEIPQWQKDLFWIIFTDGVILRIPKPFELGIIFGSVPERFLEFLDNKDPKLMQDTLVNLAEAGSPGFIPTAMLPILEIMTNYSFFRGRAIVPASREKMPPELQYTEWTSEVSKKLGELLGFSPAKIDNLINGWTGGLGRYATDILGAILKGTGISPSIPEPSPTLADIPVVKAFIVRNPYGSSGEAVNSFYELLEKYEQGEKYLKEMLSLDEIGKFEEYKGAHPELLFFYDFENDIAYSSSARYLRRVARDISELGKKQDEIYDSKTISSDEKRRLVDEIDVLKTDVSRKALKLFLGEVPEVLQSMFNESINNLGEIIDPSFPLSAEEPDIFDMGDLNSDFRNILEGVTTEDLAKLEGIDPLALAYLEKEKSEDAIGLLISKAIYEIDPDIAEGFTFEDYYGQWQSGLIEDTDFDKLTRRQMDLLRSYRSLTPIEQKDFLNEHPELKLNSQDEWLKNNPTENAKLALWGRENIISLQAYNELKKLAEELDVPESAIPDLGLPPNEAVDDWFGYLDKMSGYGKPASSARSSLHISISSVNADNINIFYLDMEYSLLRDENGNADSKARRLFRSEHKGYNDYGVDQGWWKPLEGAAAVGGRTEEELTGGVKIE